MPTDRRGFATDLLDAPHGVPDKASRVRRMFNGIASRYELINSLFSLGRDRVWRRKAVELACVRADDAVLDVACGTGDFAQAFAAGGAGKVVGCDFAHEMLKRAARVGRGGVRHVVAWRGPTGGGGVRGTARAEARGSLWCEADALRLPFCDGSFSITSCAFGVRNLEDLDVGLSEMRRVLRPGGRAVILEFTRPSSRPVRGLYELYSHYLMPLAATLISGDRSGAYRYLPRSVVSFLDTGQMIARLRGVGFARATAVPLSMGIVTVYVAVRD
jgi:demethylmenaquinone methyltransferase/2-methoxy-6-polyprenyl-1,4-benzoquinol methylase